MSKSLLKNLLSNAGSELVDPLIDALLSELESVVKVSGTKIDDIVLRAIAKHFQNIDES